MNTQTLIGWRYDAAGIEHPIYEPVPQSAVQRLRTAALVQTMTQHIEQYWGPRCREFEPACGCCQAWSARDKRAARIRACEPVAVARWSTLAARKTARR